MAHRRYFVYSEKKEWHRKKTERGNFILLSFGVQTMDMLMVVVCLVSG